MSASAVAALAAVIDDDAEVRESAAGLSSQLGGVFPDAAGEHQHVESAGAGRHRADLAYESVHVDVESERRIGVPGLVRGDDVAVVAGRT